MGTVEKRMKRLYTESTPEEDKENCNYEIRGTKIFKLRKTLLWEYQEQGDNLEVVFKCEDGNQRCSRRVLEMTSDYFNDQMESRDRMRNGLSFTYPSYPKAVVKNFLDIVHSQDVQLNLVDVLLLLKFLRYEGKSDKSQFEVLLVDSLKKQLKKRALPTDTLLIVSHVCNSFDNFDGVIGQMLLGKFADTELVNYLVQLDWSTEPNQQLKKVFAGGLKDDELESQIFVMIKKMANKNYILCGKTRKAFTSSTGYAEYDRVLAVVQGDLTEEGADVHTDFSHLGLSLDQITETLSWLHDEGFIYSTVDDYHFKTT